MTFQRPQRAAMAGWTICLLLACATSAGAADGVRPLPGTAPLLWEGDIASRLVDAADRFLLDELEKSVTRRAAFWNRDLTSAERYNASIEPSRRRLAHILGIRDERVPFESPEVVSNLGQPPLVGQGEGFEVYAVRWPAVGDIHGEGLLLVPQRDTPLANVIAIPDADQTPEQIAGLAEGVAPESQYARRLAESGCRVLVPMLINRRLSQFEIEGRPSAPLSNREFLYRSAFELGRHLIGYELQKVLAGVDWFTRGGTGDCPDFREAKAGLSPLAQGAAQGGLSQFSRSENGAVPFRRPVAVAGWGEGGMLALYAAALDTRIDAALVSGCFDVRRKVIWRQPIDRNVFGLLEQFGDAELAAMVAPRALVVEACKMPEVEIPPGGAGAPATLVTPQLADVEAEVACARKTVEGLKPARWIELVAGEGGRGPFGTAAALETLLGSLVPGAKLAELGPPPERFGTEFDPEPRHARQMHEIDRHNQWLLLESPYVRQEFFSKLDTSSLEKFEETIEPYREHFATEVIGRFDYRLAEPNVRSRLAYDEPKWTGYEVVMDVFDGVFAYGILLLPKEGGPIRNRPVVVCQHGLEGRPQDVVAGDHRAYHDFAAKLAERGFVTFAPQNLYIFQDRFRSLQRKANPIKKTLFSVIVPQHRQIVNWLSTLEEVDPERIAFYGLSYGGKTAMRVPPLVGGYCLSICSADFNEWVWKNASTRSKYSYTNKREYEIFEFDLGGTFNYAEMAALICPRPFMVERGHFDGVASDEAVAYEFAKVRHLYQAQLGLGDRCRIEFFVGPHTIHGQGTFDFLHEHLDWPR